MKVSDYWARATQSRSGVSGVISLLLLALLVPLALVFTSSANAESTVDLGTAAPFAILAGTPNITDVGGSAITGNVGLDPAGGAAIGLNCSQVAGTIYAVDATGPTCFTDNGPLLNTAKSDLTTAYTNASTQVPATNEPTELGGLTLGPGVYSSASTTFSITAGAGALTLSGAGLYIFQAPFAGTGLTVGSASSVSLKNGADACNVFWVVETATINTTAQFAGNILALTQITVAHGANITGRLLARNSNVTLDDDTINNSTCTSAATTATTTAATTATTTAATTATTTAATTTTAAKAAATTTTAAKAAATTTTAAKAAAAKAAAAKAAAAKAAAATTTTVPVAPKSPIGTGVALVTG